MIASSPPDARSVLIVTDQIDVGGKRSHVDILRAGLAGIGWRAPLVDWASLSWPARALVAGPYRLAHAVAPGSGYPWLLATATPLFAREIRRALVGPDAPPLVHVQEAITYRAARAGAGGRPVVLTVHGPLASELAMASNLPAGHPAVERLRDLEREAYLGADLVISVDGPHADHVRAFGRAGDVPVIPNFVDTRRYHPAVEPVPFAPDLERWIAGRPVVLCARRLVPKNGVATALGMARALLDRGVRAAIVIAGAGPERAALDARVRELGISSLAAFAGEIPQERIPGLVRRASVVIVPSSPVRGVVEATSIAVLESQACAVPVVASAIGGLLEIIEDGRTGLLVPPDAPDALADAVAALLADPARAASLGAAAARAVAEHHSHLAGARRYAEAYAGVLAQPGAGYGKVAAPGRT